jgi:hypothetical protein
MRNPVARGRNTEVVLRLDSSSADARAAVAPMMDWTD